MTRVSFVWMSALLLASCAPETRVERVVLISVDGLAPGDLMRARSLGMRLPILDSLATSGAWSDGVIGSVPSVTYPSHTTIITGTNPARHGIYSNQRVWSPIDTDEGMQWYWDADLIRVPTLFDAARAAGKSTAAIGWPVTGDDSTILYNLPEVWHPRVYGDSDLAVIRGRGTRGLLDALGAAATGPFTDSLRARCTAEIIRRWDPDLVLLHLIDVDHWKHEDGPTGDRVMPALQQADRQIQLVLTALGTRPRPTAVVITSDHGFLSYDRVLRPGVLLSRAGLVQLSANRVTAWRAAVIVNGGNVMLVPHDSADSGIEAALRRAVADSLVGPPPRPIRVLWSRDSLARLGGDPRALWAIDMNEGFYAIRGYTGPLMSARTGGGHGFDPRRPELHAFFVAAGAGVPARRQLGVIRQTDIAPTIAAMLGLELSRVEGRPLW